MVGMDDSGGGGKHSHFFAFDRFGKHSLRLLGRCHKRYTKLGFLNNSKGSATVETIIALPLILFLLFASVQYWGIFNVRQQAEQVKDKYLSRMEIDGYLTPGNVQELMSDIQSLGADTSTINIVINEGTNEVRLRPEHVSLDISFEHKYFDNFLSRILINGNPARDIIIRVGGEAVSEKVK